MPNRERLLILLGQAKAIASINPLCADSVEMLEAAKETGEMMIAEITLLLAQTPKEVAHV